MLALCTSDIFIGIYNNNNNDNFIHLYIKKLNIYIYINRQKIKRCKILTLQTEVTQTFSSQSLIIVNVVPRSTKNTNDETEN